MNDTRQAGDSAGGIDLLRTGAAHSGGGGLGLGVVKGAGAPGESFLTVSLRPESAVTAQKNALCKRQLTHQIPAVRPCSRSARSSAGAACHEDFPL